MRPFFDQFMSHTTRRPAAARAAGAALLAFGALAGSAAPAAAQTNVIGPNGVRQPVTGDQPGDWIRDEQGASFIDVTRTNPRTGVFGYGEGSLEMSVTGNAVQTPDGVRYPDWGFYYRFSDRPGGFGNLADLSSLSFDWYRTGIAGWDDPVGSIDPDLPLGEQPIPPADWKYKTPVLRLELQFEGDNGPLRSELIWEGYFNQQAEGGIGGTTPIDEWVTTTDIHRGNFWYAVPPTTLTDPLLVGRPDCGQLFPFTFWQGGDGLGSGLDQLLGQGGCLADLDPMIIGIGIGVGNNWPLEWHGYVDNVRMGFGDDPLAVNANFDFVPQVPEPGSVALLAIGLAGLGAAARRRRR